MKRSFLHVDSWFVLLLCMPSGCGISNPRPKRIDVTERIQQYAPHQGRLLQGFKTPDARTFEISGARVVDSELRVGDLAGKDVVNAQPFVAAHNGTRIEMRIAKVFPPDPTNRRWQYALQQRSPTGQWEPACDAPPQLIPTKPAFTGIRALAMPGRWSGASYTADQSAVTFACSTGVAAKCDGWGYSVTSKWPGHTRTGAPSDAQGSDMMQTCTQMARADYCGNGMPNTLEGLPIWFDSVFSPRTTRSGFTLEAAWAGQSSGGIPTNRAPAVCLSKRRWSTLPLGGDCPSRVPDPRVDRNAKFCDDLSSSDLERSGALIYSSRSFVDAGLYTHLDRDSQLRLTTANLLPTGQGMAPEWQIPIPANVGFPQQNQNISLEATIFRAALPVELPRSNLLPLFSFRCSNDLITSTTQPADPTCTQIAKEGWVFSPNTPGHAQLRRWYNPKTDHSYVTAASPSTMRASGWQLAEVIGGVLRAAIDLNVRWSSIPGYSYTIDVQTRNGDWITSCVDSAHIGTEPQFVYRGACVGAANHRLHHTDIAAFRVTYHRTGQPTYTATQSYDGFSSDAYVDLKAPGSTTTALTLRWNNVGTTKYSVDVKVLGADWIRCADEALLANESSYLHTGSCWSAGLEVPVNKIKQLRVCAIDSKTGRGQRCSNPVSYDGQTPEVALQLKSE